MSIKNRKGISSETIHAVVTVILVLAGLMVAMGFVTAFGEKGTEAISTSVCQSMLIRRAGIDFPHWDPGFWKRIVYPDKSVNEVIDSMEAFTKEQFQKACRPISANCIGSADKVAVCLYDKLTTTYYTLLGGWGGDAEYRDFDLFEIYVDIEDSGQVDLKGDCENYIQTVKMPKKMTSSYNFRSEKVYGFFEGNAHMYFTSDNGNDKIHFFDSGWTSITGLGKEVHCPDKTDYASGAQEIKVGDYACIKPPDDHEYLSEGFIKLHYISSFEENDIEYAEFFWEWQVPPEGDGNNDRMYACNNPEALSVRNICYKEETDPETGETFCRIKFNYVDYFTMGLSMLEKCQRVGPESTGCKCFAKDWQGYHIDNGLPLGTRFYIDSIKNDEGECEIVNVLPEEDGEERYPSNIVNFFKPYEEYPIFDVDDAASEYQGCGWLPEPVAFDEFGLIYDRTYEDGLMTDSDGLYLHPDEFWRPNKIEGLDELELGLGGNAKIMLYSRLVRKADVAYAYYKGDCVIATGGASAYVTLIEQDIN